MSEAAVRIEGLVKRYGGSPVLEVDRVDFQAARIHVVVGPNGAGKTTLLRILAGLDAPDAGEVSVLGSDLARAAGAERLALRRRIGFAAQKPYFFRMTVERNVGYPLRVRGVPGSSRAPRVLDALSKLGVRPLAERWPRTLSAGESRRVAIARAIVSEPELLLLDEPLANIDPDGAPLVEALCRELASRGVTVIVATHVLEQAYRLSAEVVRLEAGRIAPPAIENLLDGEIVEGDGGAVLVLPGGTRLDVVADAPGRVRAAIDPTDIVLSMKQLDSSARNSLAGRVTELRERGGVVLVTVEAARRVGSSQGPDDAAGTSGSAQAALTSAGVALTASVTPGSCRRLGLTVGSEVVLTFKATAVRIF